MNKKIDCRNMACPQPVLETKKALEEMDEGILEVLVNSVSSVQNVKRYAMNNGFEPKVEELDNGDTLITIVKGYECAIVADDEDEEKFLNKSLFIKTDKVGNGELGSVLMKGFLKTTLEFKKLPKNIIFVNEGVFLTTKEENAEVIEILKEFEKRGVKIYSCGLCMNHYNIPAEDLKVGEIGNAYDTMDMLLHTEVISL
ncbi:sulfurtransferase-like selenium metabolism protein YedF [Nautilia sp. PV-1]|uniref:sulfurtransferase-like selenium metabolism protein YedF n=1 Tax=Nautilia sp. PV-1 TaxID=2579250 RepID=UPI000FD85A8E|nr:sulfurtransferase-like selenium metabolism protein YedF [Nautilia sp. PV-1]AZV46989.1 sulfurtransferase-like selenium metabolism protein YedF [Nautilia sp. PV-1]